MKIKSGFVLMKVGIQNIVVAVDDMADQFNGMIRLNETGEFLWKLLQEGTTEEQMTAALAQECEVSEEETRPEVEAFVKKLTEAGVVE